MPTPAVPHSTYERHRLLSRLLLVTLAAALLHTLWDTLTVSWQVGLADLSIAIILAVFYFVNKSGYHRTAQYGVLLFTLLVVLVYSSVVPRGIGVSLLLFPIISLAFIIFDYSEKYGRWLIGILVLGSYLLLELTNYKLFSPGFYLVTEADRVSYMANFITSAVLIYFSFNFLIKAHYRAEQHLRNLSHQLEHRNDELSKANHELDRFVYSTSHDLRAPLRSILGLLNILNQQPTEGDRQQYLGMIKNRIDNLDKFIADITLYSRNMRMEVEKTEINLRQLAEEVIENHRYIDIAEPISFFLKIPKQLSILSDRPRLNTVLSNLVSNAIKYHNTRQAKPYIRISAALQANSLLLEVSDNGPGMPPEVKAKIFTMFYRGDERSEGSGLGLYIVQEVIEKLNGKIWVASEVGKGSTFSVQLPR